MANLSAILTDRFSDAITQAFGSEHAFCDPLIRPSANAQFGDYQANLAMSLAKMLSAKPRDVATKIVEHLQWDGICSQQPSVAGPGFINLQIAPAFLESCLKSVASDERLGIAPAEQPQTVVVDYSGPNVAKEMHVGHLRSSVIGDAIARVLAFAGHRVIRQNHLGDWGTQFGMLIEHMVDEGWDRDASGQRSISDLNALYQASKKKFDADATFAERARQRVVLLQGGDAATLALWQKLIDESKHHFNAIYRQLGVSLTDQDIRAESFYNPQLQATVQQLLEAKLAQESLGALCVFPPGFFDQEKNPAPLIVRKSDGGYLYATTDLTALRYRVQELKAHRLIYVTDARQRQHFAMVFAVAAQAGWLSDQVVAEHVPFGTVLGQDGKPFKTRSGETVKLADLLHEAEERAMQTLEAKNNALDPATRRRVAHAVGIGAIKYADLCNDRIKDYVFDWDRMLSFDGNTAPYLQNAYVRIRSIFRKAQQDDATIGQYPIHISDPAEKALALKLLQWPQAIAGVVQSLEPHRLCGYLYELAAGFHQFYEKCPVLTAETPEQRQSRLALCLVTSRTLAKGLELLGIGVVDQM